MQTAFNFPMLTVQLKPAPWRELLGRTTGNQGDDFWLVAMDFPAQQSRLFDQGETDLFCRDGDRLQEAFFDSSLVYFRTESLAGRVDLEGGTAGKAGTTR